jgi:PDZ domain-containing protein
VTEYYPPSYAPNEPGPDVLWPDQPERAETEAKYEWSPWIWVLSVSIAVLLIFDVAALIDRGAQGYYAFAPGTAPLITPSSNCRAPSNGADLSLPNGAPCVQIGVPAGQSHTITGSLYMVDVELGPATAWYYVLDKLDLLKTFTTGVQLIPKKDVLGNLPAGQLACQDAQQMTGATSYAAVVALRRLGYDVKENDLGAQINEVVPASGAARAGLQCNDTVTAVDGKPIHTNSALVAAIRAHKPGETLDVAVERFDAAGKAKTLTVHARLTGTPAPDKQHPAQPNVPFLGVSTMSLTTFVLPIDVQINVGNIGGPSAGLALTLGILDVLSNGNLTGGHKVAATGTINLDGTVGDVGGVAQKAVAVRRAGAQVFLVPPQELKAAESQAGKMKVVAVSTLQQALAYLKSLGGQVPAPSAGHNGG